METQQEDSRKNKYNVPEEGSCIVRQLRACSVDAERKWKNDESREIKRDKCWFSAKEGMGPKR